MPRLNRRVGPGLRMIRTEGFPSLEGREVPGRGTDVWLGIGGNLGDSVRRFQRLRYFLMRQADLHLIESSPILINPPFGYPDQPEFANAVLCLRTTLPPFRLLRRILEIERKFGRRRSFRNGPRTLDIDLLFYGKRRIDHPRLHVPHPGWRERVSVLWPLTRMFHSGPDSRIAAEAVRRVKVSRRMFHSH